MTPHRGSRKHVLDFLSRSDFAACLSGLLSNANVSIDRHDVVRPQGHNNDEEWELRDFGPRYCQKWDAWSQVKEWWPKHPARSPVWDLIATCDVQERLGLLLVEAKANKQEFDRKPKPGPSTSQASRANHDLIAARIEEACGDLNTKLPGFAISRDRHYQLSNRVAFAWRLASLGLPAVLLFLGFTGDEGLRPEGREPFADEEDWQAAFADYIAGIVPAEALDRWIEFASGGRLLIASRCLPVLEVSLVARAAP